MEPIIPFESAALSVSIPSFRKPARTLVDHLLDSTCRINLHREQIIESIDFGRVFGKLLPECIGEIVCWVG